MAGPVFSTSLIREKIVISDEDAMLGDKDAKVILSNRISLPIGHETIVVRGQNMHSTMRYAGRLVREIRRSGPMTERTNFHYEDVWLETLSKYEQHYNPRNWISVFGKGRTLYSNHKDTYMEIIEQCDFVNKTEYDDAIALAEKAFADAGKPVEISHFATVAAVVNAEKDAVRCGIIHRAPDRTTTFNFVAEENTNKPYPDHCMHVTAAFLEAINLAFVVDRIMSQIEEGEIESESPQGTQRKIGSRRLGRLRQEIMNFEDVLHVRYRPEKPDFFRGLEH